MMGFLKAMLSGWNEGRGHKYYRKENYEKALCYYFAALKNEENEGGKPYTLEHITRTLIKLENYKDALFYAEESLRLYKNMENISHHQIFRDGVNRMQDMIAHIKQGTAPY